MKAAQDKSKSPSHQGTLKPQGEKRNCTSSLPYVTIEAKMSAINTLLRDNSPGRAKAQTNRREVATLIRKPSLSYPHLYFRHKIY